MRMRSLFLGCTLLALILFLQGCERNPQRVTIGFVGVMTGRSAGLGVDGRDGFLLAVHEANQNGGIDGRPIAPLVLDSGADPSQLEDLVTRLRGAGANAAIGPMRSEAARILVPLSNSAQLVMFSPTVSSNELQGLDDFFFRNYYSNRQAAVGLAKLTIAERKLSRIAVLFNTDNRAYTEDFLDIYRTALEAEGGEVVATIPFSSLSPPDYTALHEQVRSNRPQGVLMLANAIDTAMFCQQLSKDQVPLPVFTTPWSFSDDLIAFGGKAVEGVTMLLSIDPQSDLPGFVDFRYRFVQQYGREPRFSAIHAYDATRMLIRAMRSDARNGRAIKKNLLSQGEFSGLQHTVSLDAFGDIRQPQLYPVHVANGKFVVLP